MAEQAGLKILRIISRLNTGGPTRHVLLLDAGLRARGHTTLLVYGGVAPGEASLEGLAQTYGVPIIKVGSLGRSLRLTHDLRAWLRLVGLVFTLQPDVVHTHTSKAGMLGRVAAALYNATRPRARRCAVVHTFHGHVFEGYFSPSVNRVVRTIERTLARTADRIVAISPRQRADLVDRFRIAPRARVEVIPLGIDLGEFLALTPTAPSLRAELALDPGAVVVGFVGRLVPVKEPVTLIRAFEKARRLDSRLHLLIAGDGQLRTRLEALVADLNLRPHVHFLGWADRLGPLYATMDICALSSVNEGTPVALIEAMASGKPVLATDVGGVADLVTDGVHGRLVSRRTPAAVIDAMADALIALAGDPDQRARLGAAGRERVREAYSHERLVADVDRLYERVVPECRGNVERGGDRPILGG